MAQTRSYRDVPAIGLGSSPGLSLCGICGGQTGTQVSLVYFHCPVSVSLHQRSVFIYLILVMECVVKQYAAHLLLAMPS